MFMMMWGTTAKFKFCQYFLTLCLGGQTAKFIDHQYSWLYGIHCCLVCVSWITLILFLHLGIYLQILVEYIGVSFSANCKVEISYQKLKKKFTFYMQFTRTVQETFRSTTAMVVNRYCEENNGICQTVAVVNVR